MADDTATQDVKDGEITLDDFNADEQQPAKAEPSPASKEEAKAESKDKAEAKDTKETPKADDTAEVPNVPTKDEGKEETPAVETEDKPTPMADERKNQLNTEIRDLVSQRNALKDEVEKANAEAYQPATEDELVDQGLNATDAKVEALRQRIEMSDYNNKVADAQLTLSSESEFVLQNYPWSNPESADYNKDLAGEAAELLGQNLIVDPNTNQVIGSNVSPKQLYKTLDRARGLSTVEGQLKGQADTEKQLASVDAGSTATVPQKPKDPLMELWSTAD